VGQLMQSENAEMPPILVFVWRKARIVFLAATSFLLARAIAPASPNVAHYLLAVAIVVTVRGFFHALLIIVMSPDPEPSEEVITRAVEEKDDLLFTNLSGRRKVFAIAQIERLHLYEVFWDPNWVKPRRGKYDAAISLQTDFVEFNSLTAKEYAEFKDVFLGIAQRNPSIGLKIDSKPYDPDEHSDYYFPG
jgi:hypothetical protein